MDTYYDYEVEATYMPSDEDYREWENHLKETDNEIQ